MNSKRLFKDWQSPSDVAPQQKVLDASDSFRYRTFKLMQCNMKTNAHILTFIIVLGACSDPDERMFTAPDQGATSDVNTADVGMDDPDLEFTNDGSNDEVGIDDMGSNICRPNSDGVIERAEVPIDTGLSAQFSVATDVTFDTTGTGAPSFEWDLAQSFPGEQNVLVSLNDPSGTWWEGTFLTATYFTPLSTTSDLLGVFQVTDDALLLLGVVSPEDSVVATELEYDPPIPVLRFPLTEGDQWTVESSVSGRFNGVFSLWSEDYVFEVDKSGTLRSPFADFEALRIRSVLFREVGLITTTIRSFSFVSECFGTIASITAQDNETGSEFNDVSELRRLTR